MTWWYASFSAPALVNIKVSYSPIAVADEIAGIYMKSKREPTLLSRYQELLRNLRKVIPEDVERGLILIGASVVFYFISLIGTFISALFSSRKGLGSSGFLAMLSLICFLYGLTKLGLSPMGEISILGATARWELGWGFYITLIGVLMCFGAAALIRKGKPSTA